MEEVEISEPIIQSSNQIISNANEEGDKENMISKENFQSADQNEMTSRSLPDRVNFKNDTQLQNKETDHEIDPEEIQNSYLKLISGTTLGEEQNSDEGYALDPCEQAESSEEEEDSSEV